MSTELTQELAKRAEIPYIGVCTCGLLFNWIWQTKHGNCPECNSPDWKSIHPNLVKAALALLEACQAAVDEWDSNSRNFGKIEPAYVALARAAAAKARGQE